jgi:hypothetical protein
MTLMGATEEEATDDVLCAKLAVGVFMVIMAVLRMPMFLGAKFSPFDLVHEVAVWPLGKKSKRVDVKIKPNNNKNKGNKKKVQ